MKFARFIALFFLSAAACAHDLSDTELLARVEQARRPTLAVPIKSCIWRTVSFIPASEAPLYVDNVFKAPNKIKIVTTVPGSEPVAQAFNGKTAWLRHGKNLPQLLEGDAANYLRFMAVISNPSAEMKHYFEKIVVEKNTVTIDKELCYKIIGYPYEHYRQLPVTYYVAVSDYLPRRIDMGIFSDGNLALVTSWFGKYRNFNGIILPEETRTASPQSPIVSRVMAVTVNPEIPDREFELP